MLALITDSHGGGVKATLRVRGPQKLVAISGDLQPLDQIDKRLQIDMHGSE